MNMKKIVLFLSAMIVVMSACERNPEPSRFSILGDSFSAFEGYVDPESNEVFYLLSSHYTDVMNVEEMWWHKVATETGWTLDKNNSFSGSLICNFWGFNSGPYYKLHSFIRRMDNLGDPDVIFVFGGTNDVRSGAYYGEYVYSDWTESQLEYYRPALAYMFDSLKRLYPKAKIYFLADMYLYDYDQEGRIFIESLHHIASRYDVECIDLYGIQKMYGHPDVMGQDTIASQVMEALRIDFNV